MSKPSQTNLIEIFRAGRHFDSAGTEVNLTAQDLADIAAAYDPALSEAPIVVGHPKTNAPAYGWVKSLKADGDVLLAEPHQVDPEFADMANAGRFKKRSASLMPPNAPNHPKPGTWYLRHVGFLGAAAPAVKGLRDCQFNDVGATVEFNEDSRRWAFESIANLFARIREKFIETDGIEGADRVIADYQITNIRDAARPSSDAANSFFADDALAPHDQETDMTDRTAEFAERDAALKAQKEEQDQREAALRQRENDARRAEVASFADKLIGEGRLLPRQKAGVVELLMGVDATQVLNFTDGDAAVEKPIGDVLRELLADMPKRLDFTERGGDGETIDFNDPNAIAKAALEFQDSEAKAGREVSTAAAVLHITKGN